MLDHDHRVALIDQPVQHGEELLDVVEVQAGRGLVEQVDRAAGGPPRQLLGELDALRLTTRQRRRGLPQPDVAQADVVEGLQLGPDLRHRVEELERLVHRHVQHLGDVATLVQDLEGLPVVALAVALVAGDVDVGEEVHLDPEHAIPLAGLAAPAPHVEREAARLVTAHPGLGHQREQLPHRGEQAHVGGRVGTRGAADRGLVDVDDLVHVLDAADTAMGSGLGFRPVQLAGQGPVQGLVDQRALARPRDTGHAGEHTEGEVHVDLAQVVLASLDDRDRLAVARPPALRRRDRFLPGEVRPGERSLGPRDLFGRPCGHDLSAQLPRSRAEIDDPIRAVDRLFVVFDDDDRVAQVAHALQHVEQLAVVPLVQTDRRLVEDVQDAGQPGADLGREPDALALAARKSRRGTVETEVSEPDVVQEPQPLPNLLEDRAGDGRLGGREPDAAEDVHGIGDGEARQLGDAPAADLDREGLRAQPRTPAAGTGLDRHVALQLVAARFRRMLPVAAVHRGQDAVPSLAVLVGHASALPAEVELPFARALPQHLLEPGGQFFVGRVDIDLVGLEQAGSQDLVTAGVAPGQGALRDALVLVADQLRPAEALSQAQPVAVRTGSVR